MSILAVVYATGDVDPPGSAVVFQDELVEVYGVAHPLVEQTCYLLAGGAAEGPVLTGDGDVGGFALHVLRGFCTANESVHLGAAVARGNLDGQAEVLSRGFETALAEVLQRRDVALQRNVGNVVGFGRLRDNEFTEHKMPCKPLLEVYYWFHINKN